MRKKLKSVRALHSSLDTALDRRLKDAAGRWFDWSGFRFRDRQRDLIWNCKSESAAKVLRAKLRKVKAKGLTVELE